MTRSGSILVEVMASLLIFTIALVTFAGSIAFSLKGIISSEYVTEKEQLYINAYESYMINRAIGHSVSPTDAAFAAVLSVPSTSFFKIGDGSLFRTIPFDLYKFELADKRDSEIYVIQKK